MQAEPGCCGVDLGARGVARRWNSGVDVVRSGGDAEERLRAEFAEDHSERTFAQSLVHPFDLQRGEALSAPEITTLWELSRHQREPIRAAIPR